VHFKQPSGCVLSVTQGQGKALSGVPANKFQEYPVRVSVQEFAGDCFQVQGHRGGKTMGPIYHRRSVSRY
jgi:hypothetical protein